MCLYKENNMNSCWIPCGFQSFLWNPQGISGGVKSSDVNAATLTTATSTPPRQRPHVENPHVVPPR